METVDYNSVTPLVRSMAARMCGGDRNLFDDLAQEGSIAAWRAAQLFDPEGRCSLTTFAYSRVRWAMMDYLRDKHSTIRVAARKYRAGVRAPVRALEDMKVETASAPDFAPALVEVLAERPVTPKPSPRYDAGAVYLQKQRSEKALREALTKAETDVLRLACTGMRATQIAAHLFISDRTVHGHINFVFRKWGVSNIVSAYNEAMRRGIIDPPARSDA